MQPTKRSQLKHTSFTNIDLNRNLNRSPVTTLEVTMFLKYFYSLPEHLELFSGGINS